MSEIREHRIETWREFCEHVATLSVNHSPAQGATSFQFRGQANADWKLETTLERTISGTMRIRQYHACAFKVQAHLEAESNRKWKIPGLEDLLEDSHFERLYFTNRDDDLHQYMAYLRHHGFPSPLLDWTNSPYVAAFFAFRSVPSPRSDRVAIYAYQARTGQSQAMSLSDPLVWQIGPYIRTHPRHFLQQSRYTVCTRQRTENPFEYDYASHEDAFAIDHHIQSEICKITLPAGLRKEARKYFDLHNITAYSLFGGEDSLMEMLAVRESAFD